MFNTTNQPTMATYAYLRYSTDSQDERQQLNTIQKYLGNKGMCIDKTYMDEGVSGGTSYTKRNLFNLCTSIQANDTIVVSEVSRITRSGIAELSEIIERYFKPNSLRLIICNEGLDIDCSDINPMTELQLAMLATFAKIEKNLIKERTKSALDVLKKNGVKLGRPKGCEASEKAIEASAKARRAKAKANDSNAQFAKILSLYESRNGRITRETKLDDFCAELNHLGYTTSTGMTFNPQRCRSMIYRIREY